jgi:hypothetical protein
VLRSLKLINSNQFKNFLIAQFKKKEKIENENKNKNENENKNENKK